ncbi:MAG: tyrosine-type recombinase/integrase, partial [Haliea sp.]
AKVYCMQDLLDRFQYEYLPTKAPATQKYYLYGLPMVRRGFTTKKFPVDAVQPHHAYAMVDYLTRTESKKKAKQAAEVLSSALSYAVMTGVINRNPLIGQFKKPSTEGRTREITNEELLAFGGALPLKWQLYLSLKLHTHGRRKGELLRIRHSHLDEEGIIFINNKRTSDRFRVGWTEPLRQIVTAIMDQHPPIPPVHKELHQDPYLFYNRKFTPYIKEDGTTSGFDSIWQRYMRNAVENGTLTEAFTEHDLRAKAVEGKSLEVASKLLRHTSPQVTQKHYRRAIETI